MASKEKKSGGDFVLESRHLVGLFLLMVVIFGVVFTLGYLLGRSQYDSKLRAAIGKEIEPDSAPAAPVTRSKDKQQAKEPQAKDSQAEEPPPSPTGSNWDFYHSAEPKTSEDHLQPAPKTVAVSQPAPLKPAAAPKPAPPAKPSSSANAPLIAKGAIMLQVAAVIRESDALALAQALQQKKFPAFVITPGPDKFYRVQVGPYADNQSAVIARKDLEAKGFKSIVKR